MSRQRKHGGGILFQTRDAVDETDFEGAIKVFRHTLGILANLLCSLPAREVTIAELLKVLFCNNSSLIEVTFDPYTYRV